MENKKFNFIKIMLFPLIALVFLLIYGVYSIYISNHIIMEIATLRTSVTNNIEDFYTQTINNFVKEKNTNITKEQALNIVNKNFNFFTTTIGNSLNRNFYNTIYISIFLVLVMFLWAVFVICTTNSAKNLQNTPNIVDTDSSKHSTSTTDIVVEDNTSNDSNLVVDTDNHSTIEIVNNNPQEDLTIISLDDNKNERIESLYRELIEALKYSKDNNKALDILESIFSIDDRNYLALNGAGILYSKLYSKNNKDLYFTKADKFYDSAISIYNNKDILNNKAVLYSLRYGVDNSDNDYSKALTVYDNMIYSHKNDIELVNNRANIYSTKYGFTGNNELFENALKSYNELLEKNYNNIFLLNNRSVLFFNKYKRTSDKAFFNKSISDCNLAFKLNDNDEELNNSKPIYLYKY